METEVRSKILSAEQMIAENARRADERAIAKRAALQAQKDKRTQLQQLQLEMRKKAASIERAIKNESRPSESVDSQKSPHAFCPNCGHALSPSARFCKSCGHSITSQTPLMRCPQGHINKAGARFCNQCGRPLTAQAVIYCSQGHANRPGTLFCRQCGRKIGS